MTKKTEKPDFNKLSMKKREAMADELFDKALDSKKRNDDDPEERYPVKLLDRAIELYQKPQYYYLKAHELFWEYSNMDSVYADDTFHPESPYDKPSCDVVNWKDKYIELFGLTSKAIDLNPNYSQAYFMNAQINNELGEYAQALSDINKALLIRTDIAMYYNTLHEILLHLGDIDEALVAINKAYEMKPKERLIVGNKLHMMEKLEKHKEALDVAQGDQDSSQDLTSRNLGIIVPLLIKLREHEKALELIIANESDHGEEDLYGLYTNLYEKREYCFLSSVPAGDFKLGLKGLWIFFWANIQSGKFSLARDLLCKIDFSRELSTELHDMYTFQIEEPDEKNENDAESESTSGNYKFVAQSFSIRYLFSLEQPYEKMPMDIFLLLLSKIFNGRYAKQYFGKRMFEFSEQWDTEPDLISKRATYGEEFYDISLKIMLLGDVAKFVYKLNKKRSVLFSLLQNAMNVSLMSALNAIVSKVQLDERNRILSNLSHSIKNMLKSVIDPLINLREELPQKAVIIDNAIKGANLIREIVNSINLSFMTTMEELKWDVLNPGSESMTLQDMIRDSLKYSISNMFDFRYFPTFAENYFPRSLSKSEFEAIKEEWRLVSSSGSIEQTVGFVNKYMFSLDLALDDSRNYHVGNVKSSAIKLMILFQEIIFNAVKYTSFNPIKERTVNIALEEHEDKIRFAVNNTFLPEVHAKTTGVGKLVIENFAKVLDCQPEIQMDNDLYAMTMEFKNIWRGNAQDTVH